MNTMFDLQGKKAIVVGGAGDLGFGMAEAIVEAGASCVIIDVCDRLDEYVEALKSRGYDVYGIKADISDRKQIKESYQKAMEIFDNKLDIMLNAAGIQRRHPCEEFPEDEWDEVIDVNLNAPWFYSQMAVNTMLPQGYGKIIIVTSIQSFVGGLTIPAYTAAKGGLSQLIKTMSNDLAAKGLNINGIAPGYMATQLNTALMANEKRSKNILERIPQNRWGTPDDLKGVTVFLASSASDYVNGITIAVDGGYLGR